PTLHHSFEVWLRSCQGGWELRPRPVNEPGCAATTTTTTHHHRANDQRVDRAHMLAPPNPPNDPYHGSSANNRQPPSACDCIRHVSATPFRTTKTEPLSGPLPDPLSPR